MSITKSIIIFPLCSLLFPVLKAEQCKFFLPSKIGVIEYPRSGYQSEFCQWTVGSPEDKTTKLLVNVLGATLPQNLDLIIYTPHNEYRIKRHCRNCIKDLVTSSFKVTLQWRQSSNEFAAFDPSFRIFYKSFTPGYCSKPPSIPNGSVIGQNFEIGKSVMYICDSPYHLHGEDISQCQQNPASVVPQWGTETPTCKIPECTDGPVTLKATSRSNAIVNPGYDRDSKHKRVIPGRSCWWDISTSRDNQQIRATFEYIDLFGDESNSSSTIQLYDGSLDNLILELNTEFRFVPEVITQSNRLIVIYVSGASVFEDLDGFLMKYSSVSISCPVIEQPKNGYIMPLYKSYGLGDVVSLVCNEGFVATSGASHMKCLIPGRWSSVLGICAENKTGDGDTRIINPMFPDKSVDFNNTPEEIEFGLTSGDSDDDFSTSEGTVTLSHMTLTAVVTKSSADGPKITQQVEESTSVDTNAPTVETYISSTLLHISQSTKSTDPASESNEPSANLIDTEIIFIVCGVSVPILIILIFTLVFVLYRRRYPNRFCLGRKFSTYENPLYERRGPNRELLPTQHT